MKKKERSKKPKDVNKWELNSEKARGQEGRSCNRREKRWCAEVENRLEKTREKIWPGVLE